MTKLLVIDLDQTVIDSSIRENFCYPNGQLCLATYRDNKKCVVNGIINDTLTPFGEWLKVSYYGLIEKGYNIVFLTARLCDRLDFNSFIVLGIDSTLLDHCLLIERGIASLYGGNPNEQDSGRYKKAVIECLQSAYDYNNDEIIVVDDCIKVLNMAKQQGFNAICARELYHYTNSDFDTLFNSL
jgi:hypothetical protein